MSGMKPNDAKEQEHTENTPGEQVNGDFPEDPEHMEEDGENSMPSAQEEEEKMKKKYGGMLPKKPPLISKDHERAFFDSADWALGKQGGPVGQKPKGPLEALRQNCSPPHINKRVQGDLPMLPRTVKMEAMLPLMIRYPMSDSW